MWSESCKGLFILLFAVFFLFLFHSSQAQFITFDSETEQYLEIHGLRANNKIRIRLYTSRGLVGRLVVFYEQKSQSIGVVRRGKMVCRETSNARVPPRDEATIVLKKSGRVLFVYLRGKGNQTLLHCKDVEYPLEVARVRLMDRGFTHSVKNIRDDLGMFQSCGVTIQREEVTKSLCNVTESERVVGGTPAAAGDIPWQVAILEKGARMSDHICGAVLIGECAVLTAGHCFQYKNPALYQVRVGDYYNRYDARAHLFSEYEREATFEVAVIHKHYRYRSQQSDVIAAPIYDITLVALQKDATQNCVEYGRFVQPICLPWPGTPINPKGCRISGWGARSFGENINKYTKCLLFAEVSIWDERKCESTYAPKTVRTKRMFCANGYNEDRKVTDTCQGDSGGPLICDGMQNGTGSMVVGITSFGDKCGGKKPGVYTKVETYVGWVLGTIMTSNAFRSEHEITLGSW